MPKTVRHLIQSPSGHRGKHLTLVTGHPPCNQEVVILLLNMWVCPD